MKAAEINAKLLNTFNPRPQSHILDQIMSCNLYRDSMMSSPFYLIVFYNLVVLLEISITLFELKNESFQPHVEIVYLLSIMWDDGLINLLRFDHSMHISHHRNAKSISDINKIQTTLESS